MNNKLIKRVSVMALAALVSISVVGCGDRKVGGEKLPISGITEFESYVVSNDSKCVGCTKEKVFYNTNIGNMCKKCYKRYEKYINKLAEHTQTCGKCNNAPTVVIERDRYNNPTEVACENCVEIYENEAMEKHMEETIKEADLDNELERLAKKHARQDKKQLKGTVDEMSEQGIALAENFAVTVISKYALSTTEQNAMLYIYMIELSK